MKKRSPYVLAIDIGTTDIKAFLYSWKGEIVAQEYAKQSTIIKEPTWAEQDPNDWWNKAKNAIRVLINKAGVPPKEIKVIGITGQISSPTLVKKDGEVLAPSLIWLDRRSVPQCKLIEEKIGSELIYNKTGLRLDPMYMLSKYLWYRQNMPGAFKKIHKFLQPKDFIGYKMTGRFASDYSSSSVTQFFNLGEMTWDKEILKEFNINEEILPDLGQSTEILGEVDPYVALETGLYKGTKVVIGSGDSTISALSSGLANTGMTRVSISTSSDVMVCVGEKPLIDPKRRIGCYPHVIPGKYISIAGGNSGGVVFQWFIDKLCSLEKETVKKLGSNIYDLVGESTKEIQAGSNGLIFLPYLTGERSPIYDKNIRGIFAGITLNHTKAHFAKAVMEGIAFTLLERLRIHEELGVEIKKIILGGGGTRSVLWRQIITDQIGKETYMVNTEQPTCLGAAMVAAVGIGLYGSLEEAVSKIIDAGDSLQPIEQNILTYNELFKKFKKIYQATKNVFPLI